jgi:CRISPR-associated protein Csb2
MFVLRVTYLTGRVYSAVFDDGDDKVQPEWPPHPSRLFSALVAAWGDGGSEPELRAPLEWLQCQPPPAVYVGNCTPRRLVKVYVPVNDVRSLPEDRPRKQRTFPSATLSYPDVYFAWGVPLPDDLRPAFDRILARTSSLGHSASLVAVEITAAIPPGPWTVWHPNSAADLRMRVPGPGRLQELTDRFSHFQEAPNKIHRPSCGPTALYAPMAEPRPRPATPQGIFDRMIVLRREAGPRASLRSTLSLLGALRGAILKHAPQPVPEFLSGHAPQSTREDPVRSERPHVALVPLPFIGSAHASGEVLGVAALLPRTLPAPDAALCWRILGRIEQLRMPWGLWSVSVADAEERRRTLLPETWARPYHIWATVTPFVFDRFPRDPYGPEAEQIVRQALARVNLPEPAEVELHYNPWQLGVPKAPWFPPAPATPGKPRRYHGHVRVRFDGPVSGPIVAGAGRYYGYGLFAPLFARGGAE